MHKLVNGKRVELTPEEVADFKKRERDFAKDKPKRDLEKVRRARKEAYLSYGEQLDMIYHQGLDAWKAHIRAVKEAHPLPGKE